MRKRNHQFLICKHDYNKGTPVYPIQERLSGNGRGGGKCKYSLPKRKKIFHNLYKMTMKTFAFFIGYIIAYGKVVITLASLACLLLLLSLLLHNIFLLIAL